MSHHTYYYCLRCAMGHDFQDTIHLEYNENFALDFTQCNGIGSSCHLISWVDSAIVSP